MRRLPDEEVPLRDALDRVLAEDVDSPLDLPAHTNSAMDGYAVRGADVRGATPEAPARLRIVEEVQAGGFPSRPLGPGEATRIFTGAPLPAGRGRRHPPGGHRPRGRRGRRPRATATPARTSAWPARTCGAARGCSTAGTRLGPAEIGVLASMAKAQVRVVRRARVGLLASGDEIADLDEPEAILAGRKTASSNTYTLDALVRRAGAEPVHLGIAKDTLDGRAGPLRARVRQRATWSCPPPA